MSTHKSSVNKSIGRGTIIIKGKEGNNFKIFIANWTFNY